MSESNRPDVPESLRLHEPHRADGKALLDMGYDIVENDDGAVIVQPGRMLDRMEDLVFVVKTIESLGYEKVHASPSKAVFEAV